MNTRRIVKTLEKREMKGRYKPLRDGQIVKAGTIVTTSAHRSAPGKGLSYPADRVKLLEEARVGGWDVYGVIDSSGEETSVYGFSLKGVKTYGG